MSSAKMAVMEQLQGRTIEITAAFKVTRIGSTPSGAIFVSDEAGNTFKIDGGDFNTRITKFNYKIITPVEWGDGPTAGQVWRVNGTDYAAMREPNGVILRPMSGGEEMFMAVYPDMYDRFLEMNPVLVKA